MIKTTPPKPKFTLPTLASLIPQPPARTVLSVNEQLDRDGYHEDLHARVRERPGMSQPVPAANVAWDLEVETGRRKKKREQLYRRLGEAVPPPKSEREPSLRPLSPRSPLPRTLPAQSSQRKTGAESSLRLCVPSCTD